MHALRLAFLLALAVSATAAFAAEPSRRPNVLFIFVDDMGYGDLSCTGNQDVATEQIDRLATEGLLLEQFYVASPICSPSRVGVTTGQFPARHLINSYLNNRARNRARGMRDFLDLSAPAVARAFRRAGYATAHFGKWHMGGGRDVDDAPLPRAYGFDESLVCFEGLGDRLHFNPRSLAKAEALGRGRVTLTPKHKLTETYVDRAIDFIRRHKEQPVYLHLWLNDVHDAHSPREEALSKYARFKKNPYVPRFYAVLEEMDRQIGRLTAAVDELGLAEQTLIVLTSDNGPTAWPKYYKEGHDPPGSTGGLRGRKWSLYEGGIRMPLIARWRGTIPAGIVDKTSVVAAVDLYPTFCGLAGVDPAGGRGDANGNDDGGQEREDADAIAFDGEDRSGVLRGTPAARSKPLFWEYGRDASYLRAGKASDRSPNLAIREGNWKLLVNADGTDRQLYDLADDPRETTDVAGRHADVADRLAGQLLAWRRALPRLADAPSGEADGQNFSRE